MCPPPCWSQCAGFVVKVPSSPNQAIASELRTNSSICRLAQDRTRRYPSAALAHPVGSEANNPSPRACDCLHRESAK